MKVYAAAMIALLLVCVCYAGSHQRTSAVDQPQRATHGRAWHRQSGHAVRINGVPLALQKITVKQAPVAVQTRGAALAVVAAPTNDMFADRIMLEGAAGSVTGDNTDATLEDNEANFGGGSNSVWWSWTFTAAASSATWYSVNTIGSAFDTYLAIWTGDTLTTLTQVAFSDNFGGTPQSFCAFEALSGQTYQIQVLGASITAYGATQLRWEPLVVPTNDMFAARTRIADAANSTGGYNIGATFQDGEPGAQYGSNSVWWTWTAPLSSWYTFDTVGSTFDTHLGLFQGQTLTGLTAVAEGAGVSNLIFWAGIGDTFQVQVQGATTAAFGLITLRWSIFATNDMFANRIMLYDTSGSTTGHNVAATFEAGEPSAAHGSNSVWWSWMAPYSGWFTFDTLNSDFDTYLGVWQGSTVTNLTLVANDNYSCAFLAAVGETYQIQVLGVSNGMQGMINLRWSPVIWRKEYSSTNAWNNVWLTQKGDALQQVVREITDYMVGTNYFGAEISYEVYTNLLGPVSIEDQQGKKIVDSQPLPNAPNDSWIQGFDGKQILLAAGEWGTQGYSGTGMLFVYKVAKGALTQVGSATIADNAYDAWLVPGGIYVELYDNNNMAGLQLWHKNFKKVLWELPMADGKFDRIYDNGVTFFANYSEISAAITVRKKSKKLGTITLAIPAGSSLNWQTDDKGGLLYWMTQNGINGHMTLVKANGQKVFENFMPTGFFDACLYNGKQIWFRQGNFGGTVTLASYKPGHAPTFNGDTKVVNYNSGGIRGASSYSVSDDNTEIITVRGYDKKMDLQWDKTQLGWLLDFFDKNVYCIYHETSTTEDFLMFKKDKDFSTHSYPYPQ